MKRSVGYEGSGVGVGRESWALDAPLGDRRPVGMGKIIPGLCGKSRRCRLDPEVLFILKD